MAFADSTRAGVSWALESTWGTIPTASFDFIRYTGESLNFNISNETTNEIRNDSNLTDLIQVGAESSGGINFEVSYLNPADDLLEASLRSGAFPTDIQAGIGTLSDVTVANATSTYTTAAGTFTGISVGDWIRIEGFTTAANNGYKLVTGITSTVITVAQTLVDEASGDDIDFYGSTIRNGTTPNSFSIMRQHDDTGDYFCWPGMRINSFGIDVAANQIVTGSFDFMGGTAVSNTSTYSSGSPTAAPTNDVYSSVSDVGDIYVDTTESTLSFMNMSFNVNNNLRGKPAIGTLGNVEIGYGNFEVTGSFSTYFEDLTLYNKFVNGTEFALYFAMHSSTTAASSNSYIFSFPRCKFETDSGATAGAQNQDIMEDFGFRAIYDSTTGCTMAITKVIATP